MSEDGGLSAAAQGIVLANPACQNAQPGTCVANAMKELHQVASNVSMRNTNEHFSNVNAFLDALACAGPAASAPSVESLCLPHPCHTIAYAETQKRLRRDEAPPREHGGAHSIAIEDAAAELMQRWRTACDRLHCLPKHGRFAQSAEEHTLRPLVQASAMHCARSVSRPSASQLAVQVALHSPDAAFTRTQVILAAADHTLADLLDAIECPNDRYAQDILGASPAGGLFYIQDTLYHDTRVHGHTDYASNIQAFLRERALDVDQNVNAYLRNTGLRESTSVAAATVPQIKHMHEVKLRELLVCVGEADKYVFMHAGACEHAVVFEDVRVRHADDPSLEAGPAVLSLRKRNLEKCSICSVRPAAVMAFDDPLAPESPALFCQICFDDLHCNILGQRLEGLETMDVYAVHA